MHSLKEAVEGIITSLLDSFSIHPLIVPFLNVSRDSQLEYYLHQHEVIARLALRIPIRAFIADEIGLGKTITAIAVAKYLEAIGRAKKILAIVPRVLVPQWRKELIRMGIPVSKIYHLERWTIQQFKAQGFPDGYYITSMDFLKQERHLKRVIETPWDLILVDEAHRFGYKTKRFFSIGKRLIEAYPERNILFLSATPHRGDARDYIERLKLLDPFLGSWKELDKKRFYEATHGAILFRRTKEDINNVYEGRRIFPPAKFYACLVKASALENEFINELVLFLRSKLIELAYEKHLINEKVIPLLTVLVFKRASSSPYAAYTTMQRLLVRRAGVDETRLKELVASVQSFFKVGYEEYEYDEKDPEEIFNEFLEESSALLSEEDISKIEELRNKAKKIMETCDTKFNALCRILEWVSEQGFKAVIFTEYKDTLQYLLQQIYHKHPEWRKYVLTLSSEEARDEEIFQRIREKFEKDPQTWLLIATDVVAEGVNLQVANILINYEIPWSLIKLEQRIGRVWRLGQKRDVEAYTIFMDNIADEAALNSMYAKLINLKRAELKPRPFIGEEVLWYSEGEEVFETPPQIVLEERKERRSFRRVTEYKVIQTFIKEGIGGLERLIERILAARREMEKELKSKSVLYMPKTREEAERAPKSLGFSNPNMLMKSLKNLVKNVAPLIDLSVQEGENEVLKAARGLEMPKALTTLNDFFGLLYVKKASSPITIVAFGESEDELLLVDLKIKCDGITVHNEPVGVYCRSNKVLRGADLLLEISKALSKCIGVSEESYINLPLNLRATIISNLRNALRNVLFSFIAYRNDLVKDGLRDPDGWPEEHSYVFDLSEPFGCLKFIKSPSGGIAEPPEEIKRRIEEEAINFALKVEENEGRIATTVPASEHYDIKSIDPKTGEIRKIEVKGHAGLEIYGVLTDCEAELAEKEKENYWLYIVYDINSGSPKLLRFRNPLETMNWKVFERIERRYILWPKE